MAADRNMQSRRATGAVFITALSIAVTSYYLVWRVGTFNHQAMTFSIILYAAELYGFITALMFFFMIWKPRHRSPAPPLKGVSVDVFIPTLNEEPEILRKTILGCLRMTYPHRTYILDDGKRPEVKALAMEMGCEYLARPDNNDAKAGNLNYALHMTYGEFIAVFDADHVPLADFLDKLLGYFTDERLAFVQAPQDFYNIDSFQHRLAKNAKVWTEQSLFFSMIQPGKDNWNAAFFCGSSAILRRKALEDIGGFAAGTVTEDLHTSIRLHARGWNSVYHNESLAYGISPPVLSSYQSQRLRWGQGAMQVFVKDNPLFIKGLTLPQRICYLASILTYFDGFQRAIYYFSPIVVLLTGLYPIQAFNFDFLIRFVPHLGLSILAYEEMAEGHGRIFLIEQYNMIRFYTFMKSVAALFAKKRLRFRVTPKTEFAGTDMFMLLPQCLLIALYAAALIWAFSGMGLYRLSEGVIIANIFWALLNTGIAFIAVKYAFGKVQRRREFRFPVNLPALATLANPGKRMVVVNDLHECGSSVTAFDRFDVGSQLLLNFSLDGRVVEARGEILHVKCANNYGAPVFHYGVGFEEISRQTRDAIIDFNFSHAVNRMIGELPINSETPLTRMRGLLCRGLLPSRSSRFNCPIPGVCRTMGAAKGLPFVTENINAYGMKFFSFSNIEHDVVSLNLFSSAGGLSLAGTIAWSQEVDYGGRKGWRYGLKFLIGEDKKALLDKIVRQVSARSIKGRANVY